MNNISHIGSMKQRRLVKMIRYHYVELDTFCRDIGVELDKERTRGFTPHPDPARITQWRGHPVHLFLRGETLFAEFTLASEPLLTMTFADYRQPGVPGTLLDEDFNYISV